MANHDDYTYLYYHVRSLNLRFHVKRCLDTSFHNIPVFNEYLNIGLEERSVSHTCPSF